MAPRPLNPLRKTLVKAAASLPASFESPGRTFVAINVCPKNGAAVALDLQEKRAYCRQGRAVCKMLQATDPAGSRIVCKAANPYEVRGP